MITTKEIAWAAGFLEGEGHFRTGNRRKHNGVSVSAAQKQREPLERLQRLFGGKISAGKIVWAWAVYSKRAASIAMMLFPLLSPKRQAEAESMIRYWKTLRASYKGATHCKHGHEFTPDNTAIRNKGRRCRACDRRMSKERLARLRAITAQKKLTNV